MKFINIDDKWSIKYDPLNNDRPVAVYRYETYHSDTDDWDNIQVAMFYALLEKSNDQT